MKCFDIQSIIKNYESYVIKRTRQLVKLTQRVGLVTFALVRAPSVKLQASSPKLLKHQATSIKLQGTSVKLKATSNKLLDSRTTEKFQAPRTEVLNADECVVRMAYVERNLVW